MSRILVVNAGSTSLKLSVIDDGDRSEPVETFDDVGDGIAAVGHRIVHFGDLSVDAAVLEDWLVPYVEEGAEIAPLHNRPALEAIELARRALPNVPHVAVSDSHFHHSMPPEAREYALPREWRDGWDIVRHGFHGLAVEWVAEQLRVPRLVVCHLGGGCSVTAVLDGRSVDTSMGWTPLEGLPMVTRSGSIDPGALVYLVRQGVDADELDRVLNEESGLRALGGLDDPFAFSYFTVHVAKTVAAMATALGGIDTLAFSGGIGENRSDVREAVVDRLRFLGDFAVEAVPVREDVVVARHVRALLGR
jgi:acetate kinase